MTPCRQNYVGKEYTVDWGKSKKLFPAKILGSGKTSISMSTSMCAMFHMNIAGCHEEMKECEQRYATHERQILQPEFRV